MVALRRAARCPADEEAGRVMNSPTSLLIFHCTVSVVHTLIMKFRGSDMGATLLRSKTPGFLLYLDPAQDFHNATTATVWDRNESGNIRHGYYPAYI